MVYVSLLNRPIIEKYRKERLQQCTACKIEAVFALKASWCYSSPCSLISWSLWKSFQNTKNHLANLEDRCKCPHLDSSLISSTPPAKHVYEGVNWPGEKRCRWRFWWPSPPRESLDNSLTSLLHCPTPGRAVHTEWKWTVPPRVVRCSCCPHGWEKC